MINNIGIKLPAKESIINVEGIVKLRPEKDINPNMRSGHVEIDCSKISVLNECKHQPFPINDFTQANEEVRMRYRYIDIRGKILQRNLRLRSSFLLKLRNFLCNERDFVDVETPTLFRRTPGGAREFVVPTQKSGMFYSLPQSPQQFKQLLMAGGIDRYMQIARCYRDEGGKPERQPEFTQLDLELSFTTQEEIKTLVEEMLVSSWPLELPPLISPFPRMTHHDAIQLYGTDKPDTRFLCTIQDISQELSDITVFHDTVADSQLAVKAVCISNGCERLHSKQIKELQHEVEKQYSLNVAVVKIGDKCTWKSPLTKYIHRDEAISSVNHKLNATEGDLVFICANKSWDVACQALGKCRTLAAYFSALNSKPLYEKGRFNFLWVEDFPLFEMEDGNLHSAHHPFTAPCPADVDLLTSEPASVRGQHYDLVLNGSEVGGGSVRVHNSDTQQYILETVLKEDSSQLEHLLEALDSGCPPHGGIALGLDRLLAIMCDAPSIRDVIAFPKSSEGKDLMSGAPCELSSEDLNTFNISVNRK